MKTQLHANFTCLIIVGLCLSSSSLFSQKTYTDTLCAGSQDVVYGILGASGGSTYTWWLAQSGAGTIDRSHAANDSIIQVDWTSTSGTYTLFCQETSANGCLGDTVQLDIVINPSPTVALTGDTVCGGATASVVFDFTGNGPWTVDFSDGTNNFTVTTSTSPHVESLPAYTSTQTINVTALVDHGQCAADTASLPAAQVVIGQNISTGTIYHY
jgi:hypothetical protein